MEVKNSLVKQEKKETISTYFMKDMVKRKVVEMVGSTNAQRFTTSIISAVSNNPTLQECDYGSIVPAALLGESLKLSPSPQLGQYYMVPFNDKKRNCKVAQFQLGYKGYIQLAIRSGYYKSINVLAIKEGELVKYDPLTEELEVNLIEDDEIREQTPTVGYYAMFEYLNGFRKTMYWTKKKMLSHADTYSQAFSKEATGGKYPKVSFADFEAGKVPESEMWKYSSFWYKDFDGMAYKTMLRQLISKWGIMSIEMQEAYNKDMAVINENGDYEYIENKDDSIAVEATVNETAEAVSNPTENETTGQKKTIRTRKNSASAKVDTKEGEIASESNVSENKGISNEDVPTEMESVEEEIQEDEYNNYDDPFAGL